MSEKGLDQAQKVLAYESVACLKLLILHLVLLLWIWMTL